MRFLLMEQIILNGVGLSSWIDDDWKIYHWVEITRYFARAKSDIAKTSEVPKVRRYLHMLWCFRSDPRRVVEMVTASTCEQ